MDFLVRIFKGWLGLLLVGERVAEIKITVQETRHEMKTGLDGLRTELREHMKDEDERSSTRDSLLAATREDAAYTRGQVDVLVRASGSKE